MTTPTHTLEDVYNLLAAMNQTTLGRMEGEILSIQSLLNAVNQTTLGRMEGEIKDIQAHVG